MGNIDLDPASSAIAQQTIKATGFFTREQDGLSKLPWQGRVFLHPPHGKTGTKLNADLWAMALLKGWIQGHVKQAILLLPAATEVRRFHALVNNANLPFALPNHRIPFVDYNGKPMSNTKPSVFIYFPIRYMQNRSEYTFEQYTDGLKRFYLEFKQIGVVCRQMY